MSHLCFKDQHPRFAGGSESPTRGSSIPCWSGSTVLLAHSPGQSATFFVRNLMPLKFLSLATIFWYSTTPTATPSIKGRKHKCLLSHCAGIYVWVDLSVSMFCPTQRSSICFMGQELGLTAIQKLTPSPHFPDNLFAWELFKRVSCSNAALYEIFTNRALRSFKKH